MAKGVDWLVHTRLSVIARIHLVTDRQVVHGNLSLAKNVDCGNTRKTNSRGRFRGSCRTHESSELEIADN